jgi:hypothetical protein
MNKCYVITILNNDDSAYSYILCVVSAAKPKKVIKILVNMFLDKIFDVFGNYDFTPKYNTTDLNKLSTRKKIKKLRKFSDYYMIQNFYKMYDTLTLDTLNIHEKNKIYYDIDNDEQIVIEKITIL